MIPQTMMHSDPFLILKKSPLFNLSLSSKELFHSNFLAWLWEQYPEKMKFVFASKLNNIAPTIYEKVLREDHNLDLTIKYKDGSQIVIENKVKSLPYKEQLQEYSDKFANQDRSKLDFILLSLTKPNFIEGDNRQIALESGDEWRWMSYDELAFRLREVFTNDIDSYHYLLLQDYIEFIENLAIIVQLCHIDWNSEDSFFSSNYKNICDNDLKELRIHDLVLKLRCADLANQVKKAINVKADSLSKWNKGSSRGEIFLGSGMTRSMGFFDIRYVVADKVDGDESATFLGVQLQGNSFRLDIELLSKDGKTEKIAQALLNKGFWFDFGLVPELKEIAHEYPKCANKFNKFGTAFYYRSKTIKNISAKRLVEIITTYCNHIQENLDVISTTIKGIQ